MAKNRKILNKQGEIAYLFAVFLLALGTVFCAKGDLGMSMIAAPAYCLSALFGGYMGFAEYMIQGVLLAVLCIIVRRFKWQYLLSFFSALLYGGCVNLIQYLMKDLQIDHLALKICFFGFGTVIVAFSIALFFNSYLVPCVYDLFVKSVSERYRFPIGKVKIIFDASMFLISVVLAILVYGVFGEGDLTSFAGFADVLRKGGVYIGTLITVLINGFLITVFDRLLNKFISFDPAFIKVHKYLHYSDHDFKEEIDE